MTYEETSAPSLPGWLVPQGTVTETRAGHFLQEEVPEELAEAIHELDSRRD